MTSTPNLQPSSSLPQRQQQRTNNVCENIPKDSLIDESKLTAIDDLIDRVYNEYKTLSIQTIVERYEPFMNEFWELSLPFRTQAYKEPYNNLLENLINRINDLYGVVRTPMIVQAYKYSTTAWGHVYWSFLHLTSILLFYAFQEKRIRSLLDFPTIVYHIDVILPCSICETHYRQIKDSFDIKSDIIKHMSYGSVITYLMIFHNAITVNVDKTIQYANRPNRRLYGQADFALTYNCIEISDELVKKTTEYYNNYLDWQPSTHTLLSILFSTFHKVPFVRSSNHLKYKLYKSKFQNDLDLGLRFNQLLVYRDTEVAYQILTPKQVKYSLMRVLLLQLNETDLTEKQIQDNKLFNYSIIMLYKKYPDLITRLMNDNMIHADTDNLDGDSSKISSTITPNKAHIAKLLKSMTILDFETIEQSRL